MRRPSTALSSIAIAVAAALFVGFAVAHRHRGVENRGTVSVSRRDIRTVLRLAGRIAPRKLTEVKSLVSGQLVAYSVDEGAHVEAGASIATVRPDQTQELLFFQALADERVKRVNSIQAEKDLERVRALFATGIVPKASFEAALATRDAAVATHEVALQQVHVLQGRSSGGRRGATRVVDVRAPVAGTVLAPLIRPGEAVIGATNGLSSTGGSPLLRIADTSSFLVKVNVNEVDIDKLSIGMPAFVHPASALPEQRAHISRIGAEGTTNQNVTTFEVEVQIDETSSFRPGMSADVDVILAERREVLSLPASAIDRKGAVAFVVLANGARRQVTVGIDDGDYVEIASGLHGGESVRVDGASSAGGPGDS